MKLSDVRVIDFSPTVPGATVARLMADHGADVLMVESPAGIPLRQNNPRLLRSCERGKHSMVLDLKDSGQREKARELTDGADVVIESKRPGVMERLGLGYEALAARNPRLVYASLSSYGQFGPLSHQPAHDLAIRAMSGAMSCGLAIGDTATPPVTIDTTITGALIFRCTMWRSPCNRTNSPRRPPNRRGPQRPAPLSRTATARGTDAGSAWPAGKVPSFER